MLPENVKKCDELLDHPLLRTPPPEPEKVRAPHKRRPRQFNLPPRFPLISKEFYLLWCNHLKELMTMRPKVDDKPPALFPELYLKPRRLDFYGRMLQENMQVNKELLKRINMIQRTGGYVDCWNEPLTNRRNRLLCINRQRLLNEIRDYNVNMYSRLLDAKSPQPATKEFNKMWVETKRKLIMGAQLPFILFKQGSLDKGMRDPAFEKPPDVYRPRVSMEVWVRGGSKIGKITIELFVDLMPESCKLFLNLVKGDPRGFAYGGTKIFTVVPGLYCSAGDVAKNNGFGNYMAEDEFENPLAEGTFLKHTVPGLYCSAGDVAKNNGFGNYMAEDEYENPLAEGTFLKHTVPGVLSMRMSEDGEINGQFNIIFKPLPQFDDKNAVFGRIIAGPVEFLERISAMGRKLGTTTVDILLTSVGWYSRLGNYHEGAKNTIKFPPNRIQS